MQAQPTAVKGFDIDVAEELSDGLVEELDGHPVASRHRAVVKRHDIGAIERLTGRSIEQLHPAFAECMNKRPIVRFGERLIVEINNRVAEDLDPLRAANEVRPFPKDLMKRFDKSPCSLRCMALGR